MNITHVNAFKVLLLIIVQATTSNACGGVCEESWQQEIKDVEDAGHGIGRGVFYVIAFNSLIPVPDRYALGMGGQDVRSLYSPPNPNRHLSPAMKSLNGGLDNAGNICNSGSITFGLYSSWNHTEHSDFAKLTGMRVIKEYLYRGFNIEDVETPIRGINKLDHSVVIHDGNHYMRIGDNNKELWKAMIDAYSALKETMKNP